MWTTLFLEDQGSVGHWRKQQSTTKPQLSMSFEAVRQSLKIEIDESIIEALWNKAAELIHIEGRITWIPGDPFGRGRTVASASTSHPHIVICGKKNDNVFSCDKHCPRYSAYGFCSHTFAVAEVNGCLEKLLSKSTRRNEKPTCPPLFITDYRMELVKRGVKQNQNVVD